MAAVLATQNKVSRQQAYLAGLLHDCARDLPRRRLAKLIQAYHGRHCPPATLANPALWHNPAGVILARDKFNCRDPKILRTISLHSTGAANMNRLDKIIYVADYCEPNRRFTRARKLRLLAKRDLDSALSLVTEEKIAYLLKAGKELHPATSALARKLGIL